MKPIFLLLGFLSVGALRAETRAYVPIGIQPIAPPIYERVKLADRPQLPGMRPAELELLEDALRRKYHRKIGDSREAAQEKIIRNSLRDPRKRAHIKGILAEALFLEKNPNWGYVAKPNAPQVDVYTWINGRPTPWGAQIKTHHTSDPTIYAKDMLDDHRAQRFLVPDDHVAPLRELWHGRLTSYEAVGNTVEASEARRQLSRIGGLGFTSKQLDDSYSRAARYASREQFAGYISLGASVGLVVGSELHHLWLTNSLSPQTGIHVAHAGSVLAAERLTTKILSNNAGSIIETPGPNASRVAKLQSGALRGGIKGNAIVGITVLSVDTAFSIYEHGGRQALQSASFYSSLGGSVSALSTGIIAGKAVSMMTGNPYAGLAAATVVGATTYGIGESATRVILDGIGPDFIRKPEDDAFSTAKADLSKRLSKI